MEELRIEYLPVDALKPYERNARKHAEADVEAIMRSIEEFGFDDPIGIWGKENLIVEGHGRLEAAKQLAMETVPVIRLDHLTDEQRRAYALAHNKTAELSGWDFGTLEEELKSLESDFNMADFGFDIFEEEAPDEAEAESSDDAVTAVPDGRIAVFSISAFGTDSECFVVVRLDPAESERFLSKLDTVSVGDVAESIRGVLNGL